jgi:hypothetical protein
MSELTNEAAGMMLLRQFYIDLLGDSVASHILRRQFECDDVKRDTVVNWVVRSLAVAFIVGFDLFMLYSCALYAFTKGTEWQRQWLNNVVFVTGADIFFYNIVTPLGINFYIPQLIMQATHGAEERVKAIVAELCSVDGVKEGEETETFSASDYFFRSTVSFFSFFFHFLLLYSNLI